MALSGRGLCGATIEEGGPIGARGGSFVDGVSLMSVWILRSPPTPLERARVLPVVWIAASDED